MGKLLFNPADDSLPSVNSGDNGKILKVVDGEWSAESPYDIVNIVYPVGSIYMSVSSTSPATLFGGTWDALEGRMSGHYPYPPYWR